MITARLSNSFMKKTCLIAAFCAALLSSCAANKPVDKLDFPTASEWCQGAPWCDFTSVEQKWPVAIDSNKNAAITNLTFSVQVPRSYSKLAVLWGPLPTFAAEYGSYRIVVALEETPDPPVNAEPTLAKAKNLSARLPIDLYEIIFTSTHNQIEPKNIYDAWLWRSAFSVKSRSYKSATKAEIYRNGKWNAYVADVDGVTHTRATVITHRDFPTRYLRIFDNGAPKSVIVGIIASVKLDGSTPNSKGSR